MKFGIRSSEQKTGCPEPSENEARVYRCVYSLRAWSYPFCIWAVSLPGGIMYLRHIEFKGELEMNVGDRIKFSFGDGEGRVVVKSSEKGFLKVDFPKHPAKRSFGPAELEGKKNKNLRSKRKKEG